MFPETGVLITALKTISGSISNSTKSLPFKKFPRKNELPVRHSGALFLEQAG
jgi:hypothetical protein